MREGLARHHGGLLADPNVFGGFESIHKNDALFEVL